MKDQHRHCERGSVIFYILIAVALLGALVFAVSQSNRGSTQQLSSEKARLYATEIIEYTNIIASAVGHLRLRGCADTQISFENDIVTGYTNAGAPADYSCHVFHESGGGVEWMNPDSDWLDTSESASLEYGVLYFNATSCIINVGTDSSVMCNDSGDDEELILFIPWIQQEICIQINNLLSIDNPSGSPPKDKNNALGYFKFQGAYAGGQEIGESGTTGEELRGHRAGCFEGNTNPDGGYHFYKVLIAR